MQSIVLQSFCSEGSRYCHANVLVFNYIKERPVRSVRLYALCFRVCLYASIFMLVCPCVCVHLYECVKECVCLCVCAVVLYLCVCILQGAVSFLSSLSFSLHSRERTQ